MIVNNLQIAAAESAGFTVKHHHVLGYRFSKPGLLIYPCGKKWVSEQLVAKDPDLPRVKSYANKQEHLTLEDALLRKPAKEVIKVKDTVTKRAAESLRKQGYEVL